MAKTGPKPKPTALKKMQGNPEKRKLNKQEPTPKACFVDPPDHLNEIAIKEWNRVAEELHALGLLSRLDRAGLAAYCEAYSRWVKAVDMVNQEGLTIETKSGNRIQNPAVGIANTALKIMHSFLTEYGMTPSSRTRIEVGSPDDEDNVWDMFG